MNIKGKYNSITIYGKPDFHTIAQAKYLCDLELLQNEQMLLMPDNCPGILAPIGLVTTFSDKLLPSLVSADIGCGIDCYKFNSKRLELDKVDKVIKEQVLAHKKVTSILDKYNSKINLKDLYCSKYIDIDKVLASMGTLGGGNHFIEIDKDNKKNYYLVIHSGSRVLGTQVYNYYMDEGYKLIGDKTYNYINTYIEEELKDKYLHDIKIVQKYAALNRECIAQIISKFLKNKLTFHATSIHNYVDFEQRIIRKGAISAKEDETIVIPINSRDGVIIGKGIGNKNWLNSAPHGAGRLYSRGESKNYFTLHDYKEQMKGIHSISINENNISECPGVYRDIHSLSEEIDNKCIIIEKTLIPIYNFKQ